MKKIMIAALSLLMLLAFSFPAMAEHVDDMTATVSFGGDAAYDMSNKVYIDYTADDYTNAQYFGLGTVHSGGNRMFATSSETSVIFWKTCDKGTSTADVGNATWTTGLYTSNDWTSL